jgi:drug/metabolite transporter (DMT)-like permease
MPRRPRPPPRFITHMSDEIRTAARARLAYLLLTLTALFWAGNAIVGRALHSSVQPVTLAFWRWALAALFLLPFAWKHLRRDWRTLAFHWPVMLVLSLLGISSFNTILYHAAHTTTATNIALIQTALPAMILFLGFTLFGDRVSRIGLLGMTLTVAGAVITVIHGDIAFLRVAQFVAGDVWMLVAVFLYALYSVLLRKAPRVHALSFLTATFIVGATALLPLYFWEWQTKGAPIMTPGLVAGALYVAVFPSIFAYLFWNHGVATVGAGTTGLFNCLIPVFAAILAFVFLGERLHAYHVVGLALIVTGFLLFSRARRA